MPDFQIITGDATASIREMPSASFDACFCDPPYGLKFMGSEWDHGVPSKEVWAEVLRVIKPGGYLLAFGGTRTFHRLTCAIEDAGFEIRDTILWPQSQGMPKGKGCLKPSWEPVILAKKRGPSVLNIDACRIPASSTDPIHAKNPHTVGGFGHGAARVYGDSEGAPTYDPKAGRWPANLLLDAEWGLPWSNFFYCGKASRSERDAGTSVGNGHPCVKPLDLCRYLAALILPNTGRSRLLVPFSGSGSEVIGALMAGWSEVVGVETDSEYVDLSRKRLAHHFND